jgi:hypothetical protein
LASGISPEGPRAGAAREGIVMRTSKRTLVLLSALAAVLLGTPPEAVAEPEDGLGRGRDVNPRLLDRKSVV